MIFISHSINSNGRIEYSTPFASIDDDDDDDDDDEEGKVNDKAAAATDGECDTTFTRFCMSLCVVLYIDDVVEIV